MENKIEKVAAFGNDYYYPLKYVGFGECILYDGDNSTPSKEKIYKGYEITGIYKEYRKNGFLYIVQAKKDIKNGISIEFYKDLAI
jgi:hypothetical protein